MAIIPNSAAMAGGITFIVDQTTGFNSFTAMTMEEAQIRSAPIASSSTSAAAPTTLAMAPTTPTTSTTTPTTCYLLPCYKGWQIDNIDLLGLSTKLFSLLALTTCHVTIMIAVKNGTTTTATTFMTTYYKA